MPSLEYRIGWSINMVGGRGTTDWMPAEESDTDPDAVKASIQDLPVDSRICIPDGLEWALEDAGFDWWVEVREVGSE